MPDTQKRHGWQNIQKPNSCNYITSHILRTVRELAIHRILDIGSGNGALCHALKKEGYDIAGIDSDGEGVTIAKKAYKDISFYCYGVQDNPDSLLSNENAFDAVVSTEVIEHLYSPHQLPQYAGAVIKNGGYLIISTPYHGYLKNLALSLGNAWDRHFTALWHGGHIKFWSRKTISKLLADNGFTVLSFRGAGRLPYLWKSMIVVAQKKQESL